MYVLLCNLEEEGSQRPNRESRIESPGPRFTILYANALSLQIVEEVVYSAYYIEYFSSQTMATKTEEFPYMDIK